MCIRPSRYDLENATIVETITGKTLDEVWQPIYIYSFTVHALHKCTILNSFFDVVPSMMGQVSIKAVQLHMCSANECYLIVNFSFILQPMRTLTYAFMRSTK